MKTLFYVVLGGGAGAGLRFCLNLLLKPETTTAFPLHTFIINVIGCLLIGLTYAFMKKQEVPDSALITFITTGVLGGFTTFSTYAIESIQLLDARKSLLAVGYIFLSNVSGLTAAWLGYHLHKIMS